LGELYFQKANSEPYTVFVYTKHDQILRHLIGYINVEYTSWPSHITLVYSVFVLQTSISFAKKSALFASSAGLSVGPSQTIQRKK